MCRFLAILLLLFCSYGLADNFSADASYQVCFTPGGNCTAKIVEAIGAAKEQVLVQAFSFTSKNIAYALVRAKQRGIEVKILFDKSIIDNDFLLNYIKRNHVWFKIDDLPVIAHNKVIIIDERTVITGSFNFTIAAEKDNAENVLIINDDKLAQKYAKNWYKRANDSK